MSVVKPDLEPAAGFSLESRPVRPDRVPLAKGEYSIASRAVALSTYFLSGALAINLSQVLGAPLALVNQDWYNAWIAFTKQSFGLLTMTLTQTFAPTKVIVSGDESVRGQLRKSADGDLLLDFPDRLVLVANHQIYTDWLYLWWVAYCNGMHGRLYIILKESLKKIPVLGWGMQLNQFIFLKRNWEEDRPNMASALQRLNKVTDPMWLLLFPEGTNLAPSTRAKSAAWAQKNRIPDTRHVLLPRSTGLHFCLDELKTSVDWLYDCTVAYEGVPRGEYAQDIFTLKAGYLEGRPPKSVSMHWRRWAVRDIPLHNDKAFDLWLMARWREKDLLIEKWYQTGRFPADTGATRYKSGKILRGCGHMEVPIRASRWYEFLQIFAPMGILAMVLYIFYGDLPQRFWKSINKQALQSGTEDIKRAGSHARKEVKSVSTSLSGLTLDCFFDPSHQEETFKAGAIAVSKLLTSPSTQKVLNRADFIQQFLSDPQKLVTESMSNQQQNFMQQLAGEEARRQLQNPTPGKVRPATTGQTALAKKPTGTFWTNLEAEEKNRHGGSVTSASRGGTFWQDLKAAEEKKNQPSPAKKGNFWDSVKAEENGRYGSVMTVSSNASTAVASVKSTSTRGSGPKSVTSAPVPKAKAPLSTKPGTGPTKALPPKIQPKSSPQKTTPGKKPSTSTATPTPIPKSKPISKPTPLNATTTSTPKATSTKPTPSAKSTASKAAATTPNKPTTKETTSKPKPLSTSKPNPVQTSTNGTTAQSMPKSNGTASKVGTSATTKPKPTITPAKKPPPLQRTPAPSVAKSKTTASSKPPKLNTNPKPS